MEQASKQYALLRSNNAVEPWAIYVKAGYTPGNSFWQQISPCYFYRGNALRFAKKHNYNLSIIQH